MTPPPAVVPGEPFIWLSSATLPPGGAPLAVAVMNPADRYLSYGVAGTFDHWDDHRWVSAGGWGGSLDFWGGFGGVSDGSGVVPDIGLGAAPHGVGTMEYLNIPSLEPGWYRLGVGSRAFGVFQVVAGAPPAPAVTNPPTLTAHSALLPPRGGQLRLVAFPPITGVQTSDQVMQFNQQLAPSATLERLEGPSWVEVATLRVHPATPPLRNTAEVAVTIPPLAPGSYRLIRASPSLGNLARQIWVIDPPRGIDLDPSSGLG